MTSSERKCNSEPTSLEILDLIRESDLHDMGFSGNPFTWTSNSHGTGKIKSRLDISLTNSEWTLVYPNAKLVHLPQKGSDHTPILLPMSNNVSSFWQKLEIL